MSSNCLALISGPGGCLAWVNHRGVSMAQLANRKLDEVLTRLGECAAGSESLQLSAQECNDLLLHIVHMQVLNQALGEQAAQNDKFFKQLENRIEELQGMIQSLHGVLRSED